MEEVLIEHWRLQQVNLYNQIHKIWGICFVIDHKSGCIGGSYWFDSQSAFALIDWEWFKSIIYSSIHSFFRMYNMSTRKVYLRYRLILLRAHSDPWDFVFTTPRTCGWILHSSWILGMWRAELKSEVDESILRIAQLFSTEKTTTVRSTSSWP